MINLESTAHRQYVEPWDWWNNEDSEHKKKRPSFESWAFWYLEVGALGKIQQRRLRRSTLLRKEANQGTTICLQPHAASRRRKWPSVSAAERVRKMRAEKDHWTWPHRAHGHQDRCGEEKSLIGKCLRAGDTRRGGVTETNLSRNFAIKGSCEWGES